MDEFAARNSRPTIADDVGGRGNEPCPSIEEKSQGQSGVPDTHFEQKQNIVDIFVLPALLAVCAICIEKSRN